MNKKGNFAKTALLCALLYGLAGPTFVGCKDYDDDIKTCKHKSTPIKRLSPKSRTWSIKEQS